MVTLLRSCAKVHEVIELPFGAVSGVISGISVSDRVHMPQGTEEVLEVLSHLV